MSTPQIVAAGPGDQPSPRRSVVVDGLDHGVSPFPVAVRKGPFVFSSAISGRDRRTGVLGDSVDEQTGTAMANVEAVVRAAGGSADDIVKVVVFATDRGAVRAALDPHWRALFPDGASCPVRHTVAGVLPPGLHLQLEFIAIVGDRP